MILAAGYTFSKSEWPWTNFRPDELCCRHCGEQYYWPEFLDGLQALRGMAGRPIILLSAHRCRLHNARVGGAPLSQHLRLAVDVDLRGHERTPFAKMARECGFKGRGYYRNFLHLDMGRERHWFGNGARELWL